MGTMYLTDRFIYNWQYDLKLLDMKNKTYQKRGRFMREINILKKKKESVWCYS
jgi:hypothetical protein